MQYGMVGWAGSLHGVTVLHQNRMYQASIFAGVATVWMSVQHSEYDLVNKS